jgi:hypothetical protein
MQQLPYPQLPLKWSWFSWLAWTIMLCYLLLWPSEGTSVGQISLFFGGSELTDAVGHFVLIFVESNFGFSLLRHYYAQEAAIRYSTFGSLFFALTLETLQMLIPGRGASLLDYAANSLGVYLFFLVVCWCFKRNTQ